VVVFFGSCIFKNYKSSQNFRVIFSTVKFMYFIFWQSMGWATFWAILALTHLVTLASSS
jgi:hypothetical protein